MGKPAEHENDHRFRLFHDILKEAPLTISKAYQDKSKMAELAEEYEQAPTQKAPPKKAAPKKAAPKKKAAPMKKAAAKKPAEKKANGWFGKR